MLVMTNKDNFKVVKMYLQKMLLKKKKHYFEEELAKNRNKSKGIWQALKSVAVSSDKARKSKTYLKKDGTVQLEALEKANFFKRFYSESTKSLQEKLPNVSNKFTSQATKKYCTKTL